MTDYQDKLRTLRSYVDSHDAYMEKRQEVLVFGGLMVRGMRSFFNMSVRKFATLLDVTPSFLSKVENGKEPLSADLARKLLELHGKS